MSKFQVCAKFVTLWDSGSLREIVDTYRKDKYMSAGLGSMELHGPTSSSKFYWSPGELVGKRAG